MTEKIPMKRKPADVFSLEELVEMFELTDITDIWEGWEDWEESSALGYACYDLGYNFNYETWKITKNCEYCSGVGYFDEGDGRYEDCGHCDDGEVEVDREDLWGTPEYEEGQSFWGGQLYKAWENAITNTLEKYFDWHNLDLVEVELTWRAHGHSGSQIGFRVVPQKSWEDAAQRLAETISGYGMFWYEDAKELKDVGPYPTYRHAFLSHMHWMQYYGEVYGEKSMRRMYEDNFEIYTRNL